MNQYPPDYFLDMVVNGNNEKVPINKMEDKFLQRCRKGDSFEKIADKMFLCKDSIKTYSRKLQEKFGVPNLPALVDKFKDHYDKRILPVITAFLFYADDVISVFADSI